MSNPKSQRALYHFRRANGLCTTCGKEAVAGMARCDFCLDYYQSYYVKRRVEAKASGICQSCYTAQAVEGKQTCRACLDRKSENSKRLRREKKQELEVAA